MCVALIMEYVGWSVLALGAGAVFGALAAWAIFRTVRKDRP